MKDALLTNALAHEFQRCRNAYDLYFGFYFLLLNGNTDRKIALASYNAYSDFISHLYEFYLGCIKRNRNIPRSVLGKNVDSILNAEVKKLMNIRRERILRGDTSSRGDNISEYEVVVPEEFGSMFRAVRNIRSHAMAERSEFDLADFYRKYHGFIYLLYEEPHWLWSAENFPEHDWLAIEKFSQEILTK